MYCVGFGFAIASGTQQDLQHYQGMIGIMVGFYFVVLEIRKTK